MIDDPSTDSLLLVMEHVDGGSLEQPYDPVTKTWETLPESLVHRHFTELCKVSSHSSSCFLTCCQMEAVHRWLLSTVLAGNCRLYAHKAKGYSLVQSGSHAMCTAKPAVLCGLEARMLHCTVKRFSRQATGYHEQTELQA